jgi:hypothetical protein
MFQGNENYLILHLLSCINTINSSRFLRKHFPLRYFFLAESFTPRILSGFHNTNIQISKNKNFKNSIFHQDFMHITTYISSMMFP